MKLATQAVHDLISNSSVVKATPKLIAEWEHNRFSALNTTTVTPSYDPDPEWDNIYSLDSITLPARPDSGVAKARFSAELAINPGYRDRPDSSRYYLSTDTDLYKYWSSTQKSGTGIVSGAYPFSTPIALTVTYQTQVVANKIVIGFDMSYSRPVGFTIQFSPDGDNWFDAATNPTLDSKGKVTLYRDPAGNWAGVPRYDGITLLAGVRVIVNSMLDPNVHLDVIQMGLRLEDDLSDFLISYDRTFEISDRSFIAPVGKASSNGATVVLSNMDQRFNNDNTSSLYYGLIAKRARMWLDLSIDATSTGGQADERIREFTMWADSWTQDGEQSVTVNLKDSSALLQEIMTPRVFWQGLTVGAIIWQLLDIVGMTNYFYNTSTLDTGQVVPYFWPDTDQTLWDTISAVSEGTQTAVYYDEYDIMQIKTRRSLFDSGKVVDWNFDAVQNGAKLPDIATLSGQEQSVVNKVDVNYKVAKYSDFNNGLPKMETVYEPEDDSVVLRGTPLTKDLTAGSMELWIDYNQAAYWPFESVVNIRGELLKYSGKEYLWVKPGGSLQVGIVKSKEDKDALDAQSDPTSSWSNRYTGKLIITERGIAGSPVDNHITRATNYTGIVTNYENTEFYQTASGAGMSYNGDGTLSIFPPKAFGEHEEFLIQPPQVIPSTNTTYGMRFRFPDPELTTNNWTVGGIFFAGDDGDAGYYLEVSTTEHVENIENRTWRNELALLIMPGGAPVKWGLAANGSYKGYTAEIVRNQWYTLEIRINTLSDGDIIEAYLNGVWAGHWYVPNALKPPRLSTGKFGAFIRGQCKMDLEYLYAVFNDPTGSVIDDATFLDVVNGGYSAGYIERQWRYGPSFQVSVRGGPQEGSHLVTQLDNRASFFLDEYGPVVHEVRDFDVKFDDSKIPAAYSYLYLSNNTQAYCTNYYSDPFSAKFTLVNASRKDAVLKGSDEITFGANSPIEQKMFIYGRSLYQDEGTTLTKQDDQSVRINGVVSLTVDSRFVETKEAADDLGQWIIDQWAVGSDEINVEVFGNPLVQIGDLVTINYPVKGMLPATHKYYIVSLENSHDGTGLTTALILRRAH